MSYENYLVSFL